MNLSISFKKVGSKLLQLILYHRYLIFLFLIQFIELFIIFQSFPFQTLIFDGGDYSVPYLYGNLSAKSLSLFSYYNILQWIIFKLSKSTIVAHNYFNLTFFLLLPFAIYVSSVEFSGSRFSSFLISVTLGTFSNYVTLVFVSGGYEFIGLLLFGFLSIKYVIRNIRIPNKSYKYLTLAGILLSLSALSAFPLGLYVLFPIVFLIGFYSLVRPFFKEKKALLNLIYLIVPIILLLMSTVLSDFFGLSNISKNPTSTLDYVINTIKYGYSGMSIERSLLNSQPGVQLSWSIIILFILLFGILSVLYKSEKYDFRRGLIEIAFIVYITYTIPIILVYYGFTFIITSIPYLWIFDYAGFFELGQIFALFIIGSIGIEFLMSLRNKIFEIIVNKESAVMGRKHMLIRIKLKTKYVSILAIGIVIILLSTSYYSSSTIYHARMRPDASDSFSLNYLSVHSWYETVASNYSGEIMFLPNTEFLYNIMGSTIPVNRIFNAPFPLPNTVFNYSADIQLYSSIANLDLNISSCLLGIYGVGYLVVVEDQNCTILLPSSSPYNIPNQIQLPTNTLLNALNNSANFNKSFIGNGFVVYSVNSYFKDLNSTHPLALIDNPIPQSIVSGVPVDLNESGSFFGGYPSNNVSIKNTTVSIHGYGTYFLLHVPIAENKLANFTQEVYNVGFSIRNNSRGHVVIEAFFNNINNPSAIFTNHGTFIANVSSGPHNFIVNTTPNYVAFTLLFINTNHSLNSTIRLSFPKLSYGYLVSSNSQVFNDYDILSTLKNDNVLQSTTILLPHLISQRLPNSLQKDMYMILVSTTSQLNYSTQQNNSIINYNVLSMNRYSQLSNGSVIFDLMFQPNSTGNISICDSTGQIGKFNLSYSNIVVGKFNDSNRYLFNFPREDHLILVVAVLIPNNNTNTTAITVGLTNPYEKSVLEQHPGGYFSIIFVNIQTKYHSLLFVTEIDLIILALLLVFTMSETARVALTDILRRYILKKGK